MRRNASGTGLELCDGSTNTWTEVSGGDAAIEIVSVTADLVVTPQQNNTMNVDGSCGTATCYSSNVTFTVANQGQQTSAALAVSLSNTTNFEFVSNTCTGVTLAQGANCLVVVRAKNTGNGSYTGTLQITANNNPFAILQGAATNFGCYPGRAAPGGYYVSCNVEGLYDLVTDVPIRSLKTWSSALS
jgi:hypothetical protein